MKDMRPMENMFADRRPTRMTGVAGTPKLRFYDLDFGFGKPRKHDMFSIFIMDRYLLVPVEKPLKIWRLVCAFLLPRWMFLSVASILFYNHMSRFITCLSVAVFLNGNLILHE
ncbi:putative anthocyanin 6''-O-malonyltransferase [Helianthus anomalus]